jgi:hypothetical protein
MGMALLCCASGLSFANEEALERFLADLARSVHSLTPFNFTLSLPDPLSVCQLPMFETFSASRKDECV